MQFELPTGAFAPPVSEVCCSPVHSALYRYPPAKVPMLGTGSAVFLEQNELEGRHFLPVSFVFVRL